MTEPNQPKRARTDWSAAPVVLIERPTCPNCGSEDLESIRGKRVDATLIESRRRCRQCELAFLVFSEPTTLPGSGKRWEAGDNFSPMAIDQTSEGEP